MKKVDPDVLPPFRTENYNTLSRMIGPAALVLFGGGVAAVHLPQAWSGCDFKAVISASIGLGATITGLFLAALELNRTQQFGESTQSYIDQLESLARELKEKYDTLSTDNEELKEEGATLSQKLDQLAQGLDGQAITIGKLKSELNEREEKLNDKTKLAEELEQKHDTLVAQKEKLETEIAKLNQQLDELQKDFNGQTTTIGELKGKLKTGEENLSEKTKLAEGLREKYTILCAKNEGLGTDRAKLNQELKEVEGELADALGLGEDSLKIQEEVRTTEKAFRDQMKRLKQILEECPDKANFKKQQPDLLCEGLNEVIKNANDLANQGARAYYDTTFMEKYFNSLASIVVNLKSAKALVDKMKKPEVTVEFLTNDNSEIDDFIIQRVQPKGQDQTPKETKFSNEWAEVQSLLIRPVQRVGRHKDMFKRLLKTSYSQKVFKKLDALAGRVNKSKGMCDRLDAIQDLLGRIESDMSEKKKTSLAACENSLIGIRANDPHWMNFWSGISADQKQFTNKLIDHLREIASFLDDKGILEMTQASTRRIRKIMASDLWSKENDDTDNKINSLMKLLEDKIAQCG